MTLKKEDIYEFTEKYSKVCLENDSVDKELFTKYGVKRFKRLKRKRCFNRYYKYFKN